MLITYLLGGSSAALALIVASTAHLVHRGQSVKQRKALEHILENQQAGQALVRYVMLQRQCSEESAYERIATFVRHHTPMDDHDLIERMVAHDRQSLLECARLLFIDDHDGIDKI